jgi:hypothetical protein
MNMPGKVLQQRQNSYITLGMVNRGGRVDTGEDVVREVIKETSSLICIGLAVVAISLSFLHILLEFFVTVPVDSHDCREAVDGEL